ncbi:MAG: tRNA preQ1(34) S-adenosylmethionine ribosyltransferase-isomerase QueA [Acidimicrobiales bacterium]
MPGSQMADYDYCLPETSIAQEPAEPRDAARLLVATGSEVDHRHVHDLPDQLRAGDLLVVNDTRVLPARLRLRKPSGGTAEVLLLEPEEGGWRALVRPGRRLPAGTTLLAPDGTPVVEVGESGDDGASRHVRLLAEPWAYGEIPLPPYLRRGLADPERYQTVYADRPASVAAPTAGLHLTDAVLAACRARGVDLARVELVVGLDTFRPVTVDDPADHVMHSESYRVPAATWEACVRTQAAGGRVVAVGTTTTRALESAAASGRLEGRTRLFIRPPFPFAVVDILFTNFHLPRSTLLLMVEAFAGPRWRDLYQVALGEGYRFLSFGDAMLLGREPAHR